MSPYRRAIPVFVAMLLASLPVHGQTDASERIADATDILVSFTTDETTSIPADLINRARGIAVIPNLFRGGFILGGRRGRGILTVRTEDGTWSNPAFIRLTGGSIGWQFGGESTDLILVFANENSVRNIRSGKFTLGGDASAVAGPMGRQRTMAVTFRAEVYTYVRSRGLFAGAAFEGARLDIDEASGAAYYPADTHPLEAVTPSTPEPVRQFLAALTSAGSGSAQPPAGESSPAEGAQTFPLEN